MSVPVAILAGGLGQRLGALTQSTPKSLVEVAGKPFILHQLQLLRRRQLRHVVLCLGHLGELIQDLLGSGDQLGLTIEYSFDGPTLRGTAGALQNALPLLGESFFVLYGDSYLDVDYLAIHQAFRRAGTLGLMTVFHNRDRWDKSNVLFQDGKIICYNKRNPPPTAEYIDYGIGMLQRRSLVELPCAGSVDLADLYQRLAEADELAGFEVSERFYEIGSPRGLVETRARLSAKL